MLDWTKKQRKLTTSLLALHQLISQTIMCVRQMERLRVRVKGGRGEGAPRKFGWECAARFQKSVHYFTPKYVIFPTIFQTGHKNRFSI